MRVKYKLGMMIFSGGKLTWVCSLVRPLIHRICPARGFLSESMESNRSSPRWMASVYCSGWPRPQLYGNKWIKLDEYRVHNRRYKYLYGMNCKRTYDSFLRFHGFHLKYVSPNCILQIQSSSHFFFLYHIRLLTTKALVVYALVLLSPIVPKATCQCQRINTTTIVPELILWLKMPFYPIEWWEPMIDKHIEYKSYFWGGN